MEVGAANMSPIPDELEAFLDLYNRNCFFSAHEVLEEAWLQNGSALYRGLIILAAAFCKRDRGNPKGVLRNLTKARRYLQGAVAVGKDMLLDVPCILRSIDKRIEVLSQYEFDFDQQPIGDGQIDPALLQNLVPDLPIHPMKK